MPRHLAKHLTQVKLRRRKALETELEQSSSSSSGCDEEGELSGNQASCGNIGDRIMGGLKSRLSLSPSKSANDISRKQFLKKNPNLMSKKELG